MHTYVTFVVFWIWILEFNHLGHFCACAADWIVSACAVQTGQDSYLLRTRGANQAGDADRAAIRWKRWSFITCCRNILQRESFSQTAAEECEVIYAVHATNLSSKVVARLIFTFMYVIGISVDSHLSDKHMAVKKCFESVTCSIELH